MAAFPELVDDAPVWRLQVEDPQAAAQARCELALKVLPYPAGGILAAAAALYDRPGRPQRFHQCVLASSLEARAWVAALKAKGSVKLIFEHKGWASSGEMEAGVGAAEAEDLAARLAAAPAPKDDGSASALAYLDAYREALPRLQDPKEVWGEILEKLSAPVAVKPGKGLAWIWWILFAALLAAAAWFLARRA